MYAESGHMRGYGLVHETWVCGSYMYVWWMACVAGIPNKLLSIDSLTHIHDNKSRCVIMVYNIMMLKTVLKGVANSFCVCIGFESVHVSIELVLFTCLECQEGRKISLMGLYRECWLIQVSVELYYWFKVINNKFITETTKHRNWFNYPPSKLILREFACMDAM